MTDGLEPDEWLPAFLSRDPHRVWLASGAVLRSWDRPALQRLAASLVQVRAATRDLDLGGGLRPNSLSLARALRRAEFAMGEACLCALCPDGDTTDPRSLAAQGHLTLEGESLDRTTLDTTWVCRCRSCGTAWQVAEVIGYHYPWYRWSGVA